MRRSLPRGILALAALVAGARTARAQQPIEDPYVLPDAPRSLTLPELTHPDIEWTTTTSTGGVTGSGHTSPETLERIGVEVPLANRRWFAGVAYEIADGPPLASPGPPAFVGGNAEIYGRTVWATRTGLAFGGGLGLLPPIATFTRDGGGGDVALAAVSLQPWDYPYFQVGAFTVHPFIDVRDLFGRFVVQFRQSFDWSIQVHQTSQTATSAASSVYFGWIAAPMLGLGLEATEFYRIDAPIPDGKRANIVVAPNLRFLTPGIQPGIAAFAGLGSPLDAAASSVWGLRFNLTFVWDPRKPFFRALDLLGF